jgi:hypothetical protein
MRRMHLQLLPAIVLLVVAVVAAAPVFPARPKLRDETRCLAQLRRISISIDELPPDTKTERLHLLDVFRNELIKNGFVIAVDDTPARFALQFQIATDPETAPGMVALTTILAVHQDVVLRRLDEKMTLPVSTVYTTAIGTEDRLLRSMERETGNITRLLAQFIMLIPD